MTMIRFALVLAMLAVLSGCATSKFRTYNGPEVTQIAVFKQARTMQLLHKNRTLRTYRFDLGFAPVGHKQVEGDGRTPEGVYFIDRRNPESRFHLSLGLSYPNEVDRARAEEIGQSPGGDIFIHGRGPFYNKAQNRKKDWTWGCISVSDDEIEEIYSMVQTGVPIIVHP